jgi:alcohol dehydrogenase class IV
MPPSQPLIGNWSYPTAIRFGAGRIADPQLTVGLPSRLTAGTGMDAFLHCFEAYCASGYHPYAEGIAVEGMRLVKENLVRAVRDGRDLEARGHMLAASQMDAAVSGRL